MPPDPNTLRDPTLAPASAADVSPQHPQPERGVALCLSGGGYRAMLFQQQVSLPRAEELTGLALEGATAPRGIERDDQGRPKSEVHSVALIPVGHAMAVKKRWLGMPFPALLDRLHEKARGRVLRIDEAMPDRPGGTGAGQWAEFTGRVTDGGFYFDYVIRG
jgi:hypothetical protein